jgi:hypothetical protein
LAVTPRGAGVGVGVLVGVDVRVGVEVNVGEGVIVGVLVRVAVAVEVGEGPNGWPTPHADNIRAFTNKRFNTTRNRTEKRWIFMAILP